MSDSSNPLRQDGGLPNLGLAEIDQRLDWPDKSVERISDPAARLVVLWTLIGQYEHAATQVESEHDGAFTVQNAQRYQLLSTWTHETRRVWPLHRLDQPASSSQRILSLLDEEKPLDAYMEVAELRDWMPELIHPDIRFDLLHQIWRSSKPLNDEDIFRDIVLGDMISETIPGGLGYCDNAERLRRYDALSKSDQPFGNLVDSFVTQSLLGLTPQNPDYFDDEAIDIGSLCGVLAERKYGDLSARILDMGVLGEEDEMKLLSALG